MHAVAVLESSRFSERFDAVQESQLMGALPEASKVLYDGYNGIAISWFLALLKCVF